MSAVDPIGTEAGWIQPVAQFLTLLAPAEIPVTIRGRAEDFQVRENLSFEPTGSGEHVFLEIEKIHANTAWVAAQIADFAGIREMDIGYAGRKDRHGVTRQWFSCYLPGENSLNWADMTIEGVRLLQVTRHRSKLRHGEIRCNAFNLTLRHDALSDAQQEDINRRLRSLNDTGFPNYFGGQRFGRDLQNLELADRLLRQRRKVGRDRGMAISAARSWIFNLYLSDAVRDGMTPDPHQVGPLIGKSRDPQPGESALDEQMTAWVEGLRRLGAKVSTRPLFIRPGDLSWVFEDRETRLSFTLPAGSYATSLLREVFIVEDAAA